MEAFEIRAYEVCGYWSIAVIRVLVPDDGPVQRSCVYRGDHVPIDEEDPTVRALLLLSQVMYDLQDTLVRS